MVKHKTRKRTLCKYNLHPKKITLCANDLHIASSFLANHHKLHAEREQGLVPQVPVSTLPPHKYRALQHYRSASSVEKRVQVIVGVSPAVVFVE